MKITLDYIVSQALSGAPFDGVLYAQKERYANRVEAAFKNAEEKHALAVRLKSELDNETNAALSTNDVNLADGELAAAVTAFQPLASDYRNAQAIRNSFNGRHALGGGEVVPDAIEQGLLIGLLVFVEGGINAGFFANAHLTSGPLSALILSVLISLANVSVSVSAGYFFGSYLDYGANAPDGDEAYFVNKRRMARNATCVFAGLIAWFHLTVGLVRAQERLDGLKHTPAAYLEILTTPEALFLVMIGAAMSLFAWHKGKALAGYPGSRQKQNAVEEAFEEAQAARAFYEHEIDARFAPELEAVTESEQERCKAVAEYKKARTDYQRASLAAIRIAKSSQSKFKSEAALIINQYVAARGRRSGETSRAIPDDLTSFENLIPEALPPDDVPAAGPQTAHRRALLEGRARAHENLNHFFAQAFGQSNNGGSQ